MGCRVTLAFRLLFGAQCFESVTEIITRPVHATNVVGSDSADRGARAWELRPSAGARRRLLLRRYRELRRDRQDRDGSRLFLCRAQRLLLYPRAQAEADLRR